MSERERVLRQTHLRLIFRVHNPHSQKPGSHRQENYRDKSKACHRRVPISLHAAVDDRCSDVTAHIDEDAYVGNYIRMTEEGQVPPKDVPAATMPQHRNQGEVARQKVHDRLRKEDLEGQSLLEVLKFALAIISGNNSSEKGSGDYQAGKNDDVDRDPVGRNVYPCGISPKAGHAGKWSFQHV